MNIKGLANNGDSNITLHGDVTGAGDATISGTATLEFGASEVYTLTGIGTDGADPLSVLIDGTEHQFTVKGI